MRHTLLLMPASLLLVTALGCGDAPPEAPADPGFEPVAPMPTPTAPPKPEAAPAHDAGPGALAAPVAEALAAIYPKGRRMRCEPSDLLSGDGDVRAFYLGASMEELRGVTLDGGILAGVAPVSDGRAVVHRDGAPVAFVVWPEAPAGVWSTCRVVPLQTFDILGLVEDEAGALVAGATVRGCRPGDVVTTNADGRFHVQGVAGVTCPVLAIVDDEGGLGRSERLLVESDGADVITELQIVDTRIDAKTQAVQAERMHGVKAVQLRNGAAQSLQQLQDAVSKATLSPEAKAVADGWVDRAKAVVAQKEAVIAGLASDDPGRLKRFWLQDD